MIDKEKLIKAIEIMEILDGCKSGRATEAKYEPGNYHIVRTYSAGVFAGEIVSRKGQEVTMINARRIWKLDGAASLSQLAMEGTKNPSGCQFPCAVERVELLQAIEIIPCTESARKSIQAVPTWQK